MEVLVTSSSLSFAGHIWWMDYELLHGDTTPIITSEPQGTISTSNGNVSSQAAALPYLVKIYSNHGPSDNTRHGHSTLSVDVIE